MVLYHIILLALVQGITEFLPVSSSGHLVLTHHLLGNGVADMCWAENRTIDIAVHAGTLLSVLVYFRRDLCAMASTCLVRKPAGLGPLVLLASLPVIAAGLTVHLLQPSLMCLLQVMAWMTLIFGVVLWIADKYFPAVKTLEKLNWKSALLIGLAQVLALVPGVSRSGITMTAARFLGFTRVDAAKFSLFLSVIAISGAALLTSINLMENYNPLLTWNSLVAMAFSFAAGWLAIKLMMGWLSRASFTPFAIYRIILGTALLGLIYNGMLG